MKSSSRAKTHSKYAPLSVRQVIQEIGFSDFAALLNAGRYGNEQAVIYSNSGNDNLKWETTTEWNLGIDAGLFGDRFTLTADIYHKKTNDLLLKTHRSAKSEQRRTSV